MIWEYIGWMMDPLRIAILAANATFWYIAYRYFKKAREEYGKWWKKDHERGRKSRDGINIAVIGEPKSGKSTTVAGLERSLKRRDFLSENALSTDTDKTQGIMWYVFKRFIKGNKFSMINNKISVADFAGEIRSKIDKSNKSVQFNARQVEILNKADIIIHLIYFRDNLNDVKRQMAEYISAVKKALGITERKKTLNAEKSYLVVVSHLDECEKIYNNRAIRVLINRLLPLSPKVFKHFDIIPTNPKRFLEEMETNLEVSQEDIEKRYHFDKILNTIFQYLKSNRSGGDKNGR